MAYQHVLLVQKGGESSKTCAMNELRQITRTSDQWNEAAHDRVGQVGARPLMAEDGPEKATPLDRREVLVEVDPSSDRLRECALKAFLQKDVRQTCRRSLKDKG